MKKNENNNDRMEEITYIDQSEVHNTYNQQNSENDISIKKNDEENKNRNLSTSADTSIDNYNSISCIPEKREENENFWSLDGDNKAQEFSMLMDDYLQVIKIKEIDDDTFNKISHTENKNISKESLEKIDYDCKIISGIYNLDNLLMKILNLDEKSSHNIKKNLGENNNSIYVCRKILLDNDSFFRSVIFSFLEEIILTKNNKMFRMFIYELNNNIEDEYFRKIILSQFKIDFSKVKVILIIIYRILFNLKNSDIQNAYLLFIKKYNTDKDFDLLLILNLKFQIYKYLKNNENKYSPINNIKIGKLLPIQYINGENFDFPSFYQNNLLLLGKTAANISIYLIPYVLRKNLLIYYFDGNDINYKWIYTTENKNYLPIILFYFKYKFFVIYSKEYFQKFKHFFNKFLNIGINSITNDKIDEKSNQNAKIQNNTKDINNIINQKNQQKINTIQNNNYIENKKENYYINAKNNDILNYNNNIKGNNINNNLNLKDDKNNIHIKDQNNNNNNKYITNNQINQNKNKLNEINNNINNNNNKFQGTNIHIHMNNNNNFQNNPKKNNNKFETVLRNDNINYEKQNNQTSNINQNKRYDPKNIIKNLENDYKEFIRKNISILTNEKSKENINKFQPNIYLLSNMDKNIYISKLNNIKSTNCLECLNYYNYKPIYIQNEKGIKIKNHFHYKFPCGCIFCSEKCLNKFLEKIPFEKMSSFICACGEKYDFIKLKYLLHFGISHNLISFKNEILRIMYEYMKNRCCICDKNITMIQAKNNFLNILEIEDKEIEQIFEIKKFHHLICNECVKKDFTKKKFFCEICSSKHSILNLKKVNGQLKNNCFIF